LLRNIIYNILLKNYSWLKRLGVFHWWWRKITIPVFDAKTKLYGSAVVLPSTHLIPIIARLNPNFNNPYLELVYVCFKKKNRKLNIIDVGAGIGDTFLFIQKNISPAINKIFCIEGHPTFSKYLTINTNSFPQSVVVQFILSDKIEEVKSLIHIHESTASLQGKSFAKAQPLDKVISDLTNEEIDILKIDTDGFDGRILAGSVGILTLHRPLVIFEYHPGLLQNTGNDLFQVFKILENCSYNKLLWFDKFGVFSHFTSASDKIAFNQYAQDCLQQGVELDKHYDIIALPEGSGIDEQELSACKFAINKPFSY
jgi:FkbM family methyltransferase